jgi:hypothetical protein
MKVKGQDYRLVFVEHLPMGEYWTASTLTAICPSCDEAVELNDLGCIKCLTNKKEITQ